MASAPSQAAQDPASIRDAARDILSQPEFQSNSTGFWGSVYHYVTHPNEAIGDGLTWLLGHLPWNSRGAGVIAWLVVLVVAVAIVWFIVRLTRSTVGDSGVSLPSFAIPATQSAAELLDLSDQAEQKQQWQLAIRYRYAAVISVLADDGLLQRQAGRTAGEYRREVSTNAPELSQQFNEVTDLFERAWYGHDAVDQVVVETFRQLVAAFPRKIAA